MLKKDLEILFLIDGKETKDQLVHLKKRIPDKNLFHSSHLFEYVFLALQFFLHILLHQFYFEYLFLLTVAVEYYQIDFQFLQK